MFTVTCNSGFSKFTTRDGSAFKLANGDYYGFKEDAVLFSNRSPLEEHKVLSPILNMEENNAGSFECTVPPTNSLHGTFTPKVSIVKVYRDGDPDEWFEGRITSIDTDFYNQESIYAEGELAYLNDITQPYFIGYYATIQQWLQHLLGVYNKRVPDDKQFRLRYCSVEDAEFVKTVLHTDYETTWYYMNQLLDAYGGHYQITHQNGVRYIDYINTYNNVTQKVEFGKNLIDHASNYEVTDLCTVLIPLGATMSEIYGKSESSTTEEEKERENIRNNQRLTVSEVNNGSPYIIAEDAMNTYGWLERTIVFEDVKDAATLKTKAERYLTDLQFAEMTLDITALDLSYKNKKEV